MGSWIGSGSTPAPARRASPRKLSSRSRSPSGGTPRLGPESARQAIEPRRDLAVPLEVEVVRRDGERSREYAPNLSPGGMCLHLSRSLPVGETLRVRFVLPDGAGPVEARARVAWCAPPPGGARLRFCETGLHFETLRQRDRRRIAVFVGPREPAFPPGPERPPADG
jgi:uncharacterized protein (TIGR02266 family)